MPVTPGRRDLVDCRQPPRGLDHREHAGPRLERGGVVPRLARSGPKLRTPAGAYRVAATAAAACSADSTIAMMTRVGARRRAPCRWAAASAVGSRTAVAIGTCSSRAQHQGDVGIAEIAVLHVESDVVVAGLGEFLGTRCRSGPTTQPPQTWPRIGEGVLQPARRHQGTIAILTRDRCDGPARQFERGLHVGDADGVGQVAGSRSGMAPGELVGPVASTRRRSSVTPDFSVRLLRSIVRMLIG